MKKIVCFLLAATLMMAVVPALALEARDITAECTITVASKSGLAKRLYDRDWNSYWSGDTGAKTVTIKSKEPMYGLYIGWTEAPRSWALEQKVGGSWEKTVFEPAPFQHMYYPLEGVKELRLKPEGKSKKWFGMEEIFVLGQGEVPAWVQQWQLPDSKCDLLVLFAHPDDETLFFAGALPTYAGQLKMDVVAAVFSAGARYRTSELLNSLWTMGVRNYPVIGPFHDKYSTRLESAYKEFGKAKTQRFAVELYRKYKPDVVVSHDVKGEYGHGMHRLCADLALYAFDAAADAGKYKESAEAHGTWQVSKLYLHLYPENRVTMDWDQPLSAFGGRTGFEMAEEAYTHHRSQHKYEQFKVEPRDSAYSSYDFGLARTMVGPDVLGNDFFENLDSRVTAP